MTRRLASFLLALCLLGTTASARELVDRVAAVVGDDVILLSDVDDYLQLAFPGELDRISDAGKREEERHELRKLVLDRLIADKLIEAAIIEDNILVTDEEVERAMERMAEDNGMTMIQFEGAVIGQGSTMSQFRQEMKDEMQRQRFIQFEIYNRVSVDESQVRGEYERRKSEAAAPSLARLQVMRVPVDAPALPQEPAGEGDPAEGEADEPAIRAIDAVGAALEAGEDFDAVASRYSTMYSAERGSTMSQPVDLSQWNENFRPAVEGLKVGEVSEPVEYSGAFWRFKLIGMEAAAFPPYEEIRGALTNELWERELERQLQRWVERRRAKAHVEVRL